MHNLKSLLASNAKSEFEEVIRTWDGVSHTASCCAQNLASKATWTPKIFFPATINDQCRPSQLRRITVHFHMIYSRVRCSRMCLEHRCQDRSFGSRIELYRRLKFWLLYTKQTKTEAFKDGGCEELWSNMWQVRAGFWLGWDGGVPVKQSWQSKPITLSPLPIHLEKDLS
jgi:hypothetical protein